MATKFRTRYNAKPAAGQKIDQFTMTEPDKGISIKQLMDKYQRPQNLPQEQYFPDIAIPVFPRSIDPAFAQAQREATEDHVLQLSKNIDTHVKKVTEHRERIQQNKKAAQQKADEGGKTTQQAT